MIDLHRMRDELLGAWARAVTRRPRLTLAVCALAALLSIVYTLTNLTFKSDRSDLIDPSLPWQQRYAAFKREFPRWDDAVVVVDRGETEETRSAAESFIAQLESALRDDPRFPAVTAGFARDEAPVGLLLTQPIERVRAVAEELTRAAPVIAAPSLDALLNLSTLAGPTLDASAREGLLGLLERTRQAGETPRASAAGTAARVSVLGMEQASGTERLITSTGRLATVLVSLPKQPESARSPVEADSGVNAPAAGLEALRSIIAGLLAKPEHDSVRAGVTGVPVLESDETTLSTRDATLASLISLALIIGLMLIAYRGAVVPIFAAMALLVGMAWSFAWATLAVGHLQLLSITFASMLLGLGIDVAIHIIARLELVHADHDHLASAIEEVFRGVGPGILTASLTISAASAAMAATDFEGVAEMGIIAGGGILLCTMSILCVLPALLMLMGRPERRLRTHEGGVSRAFMGEAGVAFHRRPGLVVLGACIVLAPAGWLTSHARYDSDLQKLMPSTTESVVWQRRLEQDDERSVWHAVVVCADVHAARDATLRLRALPEVSDVGGFGMLVQEAEELKAKDEALARLPDARAALEAARAAPAPSAAQSEALRLAASALEARWREGDPALSEAARRVASLSDDGADRALAMYHADRIELLQRMIDLRAARLPEVDELPAALRSLFIGETGGLLLRVYPKASAEGQSVLSPARLGPFARAVLHVAPEATGPAIQIHESTHLITRAYVASGFYALGAIVVLLVMDFGFSRRGVCDTLCALLPVALGGVIMLAIMSIARVPLNFANMIVLPLLVGIGVGCGVHVVRRWRLQPNDRPAGLAGGSGRAVTLTTLTTVFGFAAMMTGEHQGIWSLGFVMSAGLAAVWVVSIALLPAVLAWRSPNGGEDPRN